jgi:hypothetical protein
MGDDCPVEQCQIRNAQHTLLYSSILKGTSTALDSLTKTNGNFAQQRQFGTRDKFPAEMCHYQHSTAAPLYPTLNDPAAQILSCNSGTGTRAGMGPVDPMDGSGLAQGRSEPSYLPRLPISSQLQIISRFIASGFKVKWMPRWLGFGR